MATYSDIHSLVFELPAEVIEQIVQKHMQSLTWQLPKEMRGERLRIVMGGDVIDNAPLTASIIYHVESRNMIYAIDSQPINPELIEDAFNYVKRHFLKAHTHRSDYTMPYIANSDDIGT